MTDRIRRSRLPYDRWDAYRADVHARQLELGIIPPGTELSRHDPDVQEWDALSNDERRAFSRMMEVFAGFLEHTDHYIGELLRFLADMDEYDNTLIMLVSDNGSSAEGGPTGSINECRFFNGVGDTIEEILEHLDALDIEPPLEIRGVTQSAIEGTSFAYTFVDGSAATSFVESGRAFGTPLTAEILQQLDATAWELYHVDEDFAETRDLAAQERDRLIEMITLWYVEAGRYNVLPLDGRGIQRIAEERPQISVDRNRYVLYPNTQSIPAAAAPRILNRPYSISAEVDIPEGGADGVLLSMGGVDGGISFYVLDGRLSFAHNYLSMNYMYARSDDAVTPGRDSLSMEFEPTGEADRAKGRGTPGTVRLFIDGYEVGSAAFPVTTPNRLGQGAAMQVGVDSGGAVTPEYEAPFRFTGTITRVIVDVSGEHIVDYEAETRIALAKQ